MKKMLMALLAGLFVACSTLSAATNYVSQSEMNRMNKAVAAYVAKAENYAARAEKVSNLEEHIALTKDFVLFLENDAAIKDAPEELKKYFDTIRVRMGQALKFVQDAPNWQGSEEEWQKRLQKIADSVDAKEKEMVEYMKSCQVERKTRWRIPLFVYWVLGGIIISAVTGAYNMLKKK